MSDYDLMSSDDEAPRAAPHAPVFASSSSSNRKRKAASSCSSSSDSSSDSSDSSDSSSDDSDDSDEHRAPITDAREISIDLAGLNESLTCKLCKGYYRECQTIMDCLHSFCKVCLERHIVNTRRNDVVGCPIKGCLSQMIATHPMKTEVRFDRVMQNLVDKLLPQFAQADEDLKHSLAVKYGKATDTKKKPAASEQPAKKTKFGDEKFGHEKLMIFELRPFEAGDSNSSASSSLAPLSYPFVKTSAKVTVKSLRKFLIERLGLPANSMLDIQCSGEVLGSDHSIEFVWRTRWHHLHPAQHLVLTYRQQAHAL